MCYTEDMAEMPSVPTDALPKVEDKTPSKATTSKQKQAVLAWFDLFVGDENKIKNMSLWKRFWLPKTWKINCLHCFCSWNTFYEWTKRRKATHSKCSNLHRRWWVCDRFCPFFNMIYETNHLFVINESMHAMRLYRF